MKNSISIIFISQVFLFGFGPFPIANVFFHNSPDITVPSYEETKRIVLKIKSQIFQEQITEDSLSTIFTSLLTEKLIPHWLTTPWSFEGHTSIPREGEIACGYFVSTILRDMGFNLNRYTFAQQLPIHEAKTLNLGNQLLEINSSSTIEIFQ